MTCKACHAWSTCKSWHAWSTYVKHGMQAWSTCHGQHVKHGLHVHMTCKLWHAWSSITCLLGTHGVQRDVTHAHLDDNLHHHVLFRPRFVQAFMACSSQGCQLGVSLLTCTRWLNRLAMHEHPSFNKSRATLHCSLKLFTSDENPTVHQEYQKLLHSVTTYFIIAKSRRSPSLVTIT